MDLARGRGRVTSRPTLQKWQEAEKAWIKNNDQLQKLVTSYSNNCSIISEIRALDKRKAIFDENVRNGHSKYQLESNDLQARILSLQQHLTCQPQ
jgi:hypothetical protein